MAPKDLNAEEKYAKALLQSRRQVRGKSGAPVVPAASAPEAFEGLWTSFIEASMPAVTAPAASALGEAVPWITFVGHLACCLTAQSLAFESHAQTEHPCQSLTATEQSPVWSAVLFCAWSGSTRTPHTWPAVDAQRQRHFCFEQPRPPVASRTCARP